MKKLIAISIVMLFCSPVFAGSVTGSVQFSGTAPKAEPLSMNADPTCAAAHSTPVLDQSVLVNANGTLKNVFVYVKEGLEGKTFETSKTPVQIDQKGCMYNPRVLGLQVGQPLEIVNSDSTLHNVHSLAEKSKQFNLGMPLQGMKINKKFDQPEVMVKFKCDVHPWMAAYIGVLPHPHFAVSGDDGSFKIENLPAGEYTIEAWHEKYGVQTQKVTVTDADAAKADFSFKG